MTSVGNAVKVALLNIVQKERSKEVGIDVLHQFDEIGVVKLKGRRKLHHQLVDTIQELEKDGASLIQILASAKQSTSVGELVSVLDPFSLH